MVDPLALEVSAEIACRFESDYLYKKHIHIMTRDYLIYK